jgi:hypothetical protein
MAPLYVVGQTVTFTRGSFSYTTTIVAVVNKEKTLSGTDLTQPQIYIIAHSLGWLPSPQLITMYQLDPNTRYIYVREDELSPD